ncbi:MAG: C2 family cysteine protease [Pirellulaceae bacterium]
MTIALVGTELQVYGSGNRDEVTISIGRDSVLTAVRDEYIGTVKKTESKSYDSSLVSSILVRAGDGNDLVTNNTSKRLHAYGGFGDDILLGGSGNDKLYGQGGNDLHWGYAGHDEIDGGAGDDTLRGGIGNDLLFDEEGNNQFHGDDGDDILNDGDGASTLRGGDGSDKIYADDGADWIYGESGNDIILGEGGNDTIRGGLGNDLIDGQAGADLIYGEDGDDSLRGGDDNDILNGGLGADNIRGNNGNDRLYGRENGLSRNALDGANVLYGEDGNDRIYGFGGIDTIYGGIGNDQIVGGGANDFLYGETGDDIILGEAGNDVIDGSYGNDLLSGNDGDDQLKGSFGKDQLLGDDGNDSLKGESDQDILKGGNGNDVLEGGTYDDRLFGEAGNDQLFGNEGRDALFGGIGSDQMYGGLGADKIISVDGALDLIFGGDGVATSDRDELWLDQADALPNLPAVNAVKAIDPKAVHTINNFRSYTVNGVPVGTPMTLGVDLVDPSPTTEDIGDVSLTKASYTIPLFPEGGIAYDNIDQGAIGTCYFLARLSSLAKTHPQHIYDMVTELGDGSYAVQFYNQSGGRVFVRVDSDFYKNNETNDVQYARYDTAHGMWVAVIEKAWAIHRYGTGSYNQIEGGNSANVNTSKALGLNHLDIWANLHSPASFVNVMQSALSAGKTVIMSGPAAISDTLAMTAANKHNGEHVMVVHSIETNAAGQPTKVKLYKLYGGPLVEISDFTRLQFFASKAVIAEPA